MRSPRSVTIVPIGMPFLTLKRRSTSCAARHRFLAADARELVGAGIDDLRVRGRLAEPMLTTTFWICGTAMTFL
jgi:hypothetical protein